MAAAAIAQNSVNTPSPHSHSSQSSASASPQTNTSRLPSNVPQYTQEDVVRFIQAALAAAYRDQGLHPHARPANSPNAQVIQEEQRIMKPRVHMYEAFVPKRTMITTLELPGLQKDDVSITARPNGDLIVSGERRPQHLLYLQNIAGSGESDADQHGGSSEEKGRTIFNELKFGRFQRVIRLPIGTDVST